MGLLGESSMMFRRLFMKHRALLESHVYGLMITGDKEVNDEFMANTHSKPQKHMINSYFTT
jgi:hypothetical protein